MRCRKCGAAISVAVRAAGQKPICSSCKKAISDGLADFELELTAKVKALKQQFNRKQS